MVFRSGAAFLFTMGAIAIAIAIATGVAAGRCSALVRWARRLPHTDDCEGFFGVQPKTLSRWGHSGMWARRGGRGTPGTAAHERPLPPAQREHLPYLACDLAGATDNVAPAVTQNGLPGDGCVVVPAIVAERPVFRMRLSAVQLHEHPPSRIPNVAVAAAAGGCDLGMIAESGRQTVDTFYLPSVTKFERRCDPVGRLGEDLADELSPTVARSRTQRCAESAGGGESALDRLKDEMDCHRTVLPVAHIEQRPLEAEAPRVRARVSNVPDLVV